MPRGTFRGYRWLSSRRSSADVPSLRAPCSATDSRRSRRARGASAGGCLDEAPLPVGEHDSALVFESWAALREQAGPVQPIRIDLDAVAPGNRHRVATPGRVHRPCGPADDPWVRGDSVLRGSRPASQSRTVDRGGPSSLTAALAEAPPTASAWAATTADPERIRTSVRLRGVEPPRP
jgi:hypothetical protein